MVPNLTAIAVLPTFSGTWTVLSAVDTIFVPRVSIPPDAGGCIRIYSTMPDCPDCRIENIFHGRAAAYPRWRKVSTVVRTARK